LDSSVSVEVSVGSGIYGIDKSGGLDNTLVGSLIRDVDDEELKSSRGSSSPFNVVSQESKSCGSNFNVESSTEG